MPLLGVRHPFSLRKLWARGLPHFSFVFSVSLPGLSCLKQACIFEFFLTKSIPCGRAVSLSCLHPAHVVQRWAAARVCSPRVAKHGAQGGRGQSPRPARLCPGLSPSPQPEAQHRARNGGGSIPLGGKFPPLGKHISPLCIPNTPGCHTHGPLCPSLTAAPTRAPPMQPHQAPRGSAHANKSSACLARKQQ